MNERVGLPQWVSASEFARIIGVNRSYVSKLKTQGKLVTRETDSGDVQIDVLATYEVLRQGADPNRWHLAEWNEKQRGILQSKGGGDSPKVPSKNKTFWDAKTRAQVADAELKEIEVATRRGLVCDVEGVESAGFEFARSALNALLGATPRWAAVVTLETNLEANRRYLETQVLETLAQIRAPKLAGKELSFEVPKP
jgi:hypothetical protein